MSRAGALPTRFRLEGFKRRQLKTPSKSSGRGLVTDPSASFRAREPGSASTWRYEAWEAAADSLDPKVRGKLDGLVKSKREGQARGNRELGGPSGYREHPCARDVDLVLSKASVIKEDDKKATWRLVSWDPY